MAALHSQLLQHVLPQRQRSRRSAPTTGTTTPAAAAAAAAADDDDDDDDDVVVQSELKRFDDAVFGLLRQVAARRDFSPFAEVNGLFTVSSIQHSWG